MEFHEEDFRVKELNKDGLREVFGDLEFRTLGKRILGEEISIGEAGSEKKIPAGVQQDLFGNVVESSVTPDGNTEPEAESMPVHKADKNINNTPHNYQAIEEEKEIRAFVQIAHGQVGNLL